MNLVTACAEALNVSPTISADIDNIKHGNGSSKQERKQHQSRVTFAPSTTTRRPTQLFKSKLPALDLDTVETNDRDRIRVPEPITPKSPLMISRDAVEADMERLDRLQEHIQEPRLRTSSFA